MTIRITKKTSKLNELLFTLTGSIPFPLVQV